MSQAIRGKTLAWRMSVAINTAKELFSKFVKLFVIEFVTRLLGKSVQDPCKKRCT